MNTEQIIKHTDLSSLLPCPFCGSVPKLKSGKVKCADKLDRTPGLALDSGEFIPAEKMTDWSKAV